MTNRGRRDVRSLYDRIGTDSSKDAALVRELVDDLVRADDEVAVEATRYVEKLAEDRADLLVDHLNDLSRAYLERSESAPDESIRRSIVLSIRRVAEDHPRTIENPNVRRVIDDVLELDSGTNAALLRDAFATWTSAVTVGVHVPEDVINACGAVLDHPRLLQAKEAAIDLVETALRSGQDSRPALLVLLLGTQDPTDRITRASLFALCRVALERPEPIAKHDLIPQVNEVIRKRSAELEISDDVVERAVDALSEVQNDGR